MIKRNGSAAAWSLAVWLVLFINGRGGKTENGAAVVFNSSMEASRSVAQYYASKRGIPENRLIGLPLPSVETIDRKTFQEKLQNPLFDILRARKLLRFKETLRPASRNRPGNVEYQIEKAEIRYLTLCYGVPVKISHDPAVKEDGADQIQKPLRTNAASVDGELAWLPSLHSDVGLYGVITNPFYNAADRAEMTPLKGVLMVGRLDGPTPEVAKSLVDRALEAEKSGLWGRGYFDARGIEEGAYQLGDLWIKKAYELSEKAGWECELDAEGPTLGRGYPLSQVGLYAGWYAPHATGPFAADKVEFMPGAVAYHLHSHNAQTLRSSSKRWAGPLLDKGAAATIGYVHEPYLQFTVHLGILFSRLFHGFSWGEAAFAAQPGLSWQAVALGDPLYRPYKTPPDELHRRLSESKSDLIEWSHLRIVNLNQVQGAPAAELIGYIQRRETASSSAVLQEKLAQLYYHSGKIEEAMEAYERALNLNPTYQQKKRLILKLAPLYSAWLEPSKALALYQRFLDEYPDYPDRASILRDMAGWAEDLGKPKEAERLRKQIDALE